VTVTKPVLATDCFFDLDGLEDDGLSGEDETEDEITIIFDLVLAAGTSFGTGLGENAVVDDAYRSLDGGLIMLLKFDLPALEEEICSWLRAAFNELDLVDGAVALDGDKRDKEAKTESMYFTGLAGPFEGLEAAGKVGWLFTLRGEAGELLFFTLPTNSLLASSPLANSVESENLLPFLLRRGEVPPDSDC
jgi:hypothetical protein